MSPYSRRTFLKAGLSAGASLSAGARLSFGSLLDDIDLDNYLQAQRQALRIPGLAACLIKGKQVVWSQGYGWANIRNRTPMNPEHTVQNIA